MAFRGDRESVDGSILNPLVERFQRVLGEARQRGESVGLLLIKCTAIDQMDATQGFHAGDRLAQDINHLLKTKALRETDLVERVSRDEFACILRPASSEGVAMLAAHRMLKLLAVPLAFGDRLVTADAAVGIALFPEHGQDADVILQHAKFALRGALDQHDRVCVFTKDDSESPSDQLIYEQRLRLALEQNKLLLAFQPQIELHTGRIVGAEALLRWNDEELGTVPPHLVVAAAESAGLIDQLSFWVITSAVQHYAEFQKIDPRFSVSVNVSPSNLREADLPFHVDRALRTWGVPGENLVVEITETAMLIDQKAANETLHELKSHGIRLSIDDFGTGYSSIFYLAQLPLDELKIDLMFVRAMLEVPNYAKIVRSLIDLSHNLELTVVAEGVENEDIQSALKHLGCDRAQGYHIGKPGPAVDLLERLRAQAGSGPQAR
ncbi:MAG: GGDEF domain-containing phosphodiesterase [Betaproteobacteria bacterium]|nr:GGDEF domain-containing phosphodiesterase [Betaproteobacteria bacterium]MDH3437086.1 GGDEF domain-containing phosphodiesterase [Betaproteobacteria bacterium]